MDRIARALDEERERAAANERQGAAIDMAQPPMRSCTSAEERAKELVNRVMPERQEEFYFRIRSILFVEVIRSLEAHAAAARAEEREACAALIERFHHGDATMMGTEAAEPIFHLRGRSPYVQISDTASFGEQHTEVTESPEASRQEALTTGLSKMQQILEYLRALNRARTKLQFCAPCSVLERAAAAIRNRP